MASWNLPTTHATGDVLSVTDWNNVANDVTFLYQAPYAQLSQSTSLTAGSGSNHAFQNFTIAQSNYGFTFNAASGSITYAIVPLSGIYFAAAEASFETNAVSGTYTITSNLTVNGGTVGQGSSAYPNGAIPTTTASQLLYLGAGTEVGYSVYQNTGINQFTTGAYLHLVFLGSL